jgi:deoxyribonuclease-4
MDRSLPVLGAHMSMAGGYFKAVERGLEVGCRCVQMFTKNNNQWMAPELTDEDVSLLQATLRESPVHHLLAHSSYLINLGSPDPPLWKKSIDALVVELERAARLGIPFVVLHPGAYTTSSEEAGLQRIIAALDEVQSQTRDLPAACLLENTAGQGSCLGWRFEHLATILDGVRDPDRMGICFDTCHAFAAGYGLADKADYRQTMRALQNCVGLEKIRAIHLNDSKRELGSRVDRHEHIGKGMIGKDAFTRLLNDRHFRNTPMYLETPKGDDPKSGKAWDVVNLQCLRRLSKRTLN